MIDISSSIHKINKIHTPQIPNQTSHFPWVFFKFDKDFPAKPSHATYPNKHNKRAYQFLDMTVKIAFNI